MSTFSPPRHEPMTDRDMHQLHDDDLHAARIVVGLMTGVFVMGLLLYAFILWIVW
jgi:hypothetical protein